MEKVYRNRRNRVKLPPKWGDYELENRCKIESYKQMQQKYLVVVTIEAVL